MVSILAKCLIRELNGQEGGRSLPTLLEALDDGTNEATLQMVR